MALAGRDQLGIPSIRGEELFQCFLERLPVARTRGVTLLHGHHSFPTPTISSSPPAGRTWMLGMCSSPKSNDDADFNCSNYREWLPLDCHCMDHTESLPSSGPGTGKRRERPLGKQEGWRKEKWETESWRGRRISEPGGSWQPGPAQPEFGMNSTQDSF